jgi:AraC-like DNA-binding protein
MKESSMPFTSERVAPTPDAGERVAPTRAWRPCQPEVADIICIEEPSNDLPARIHDWFSVTVVRSAAVVRCESSRSLVAARTCVLLVPALQLYSLRAQSRPTRGTATLLIGPSLLKDLEGNDRALVVTDVTLVEQVEALVSQMSRPVASLDWPATMRALLGRLLASGAPVDSLPPRQGTPLGAAREHLRAHAAKPVSIADLADLMGLAESHLIRAFHREFGLPPHAYQMRLRLSAAGELLARGLSVSTVAFECGFADQSHLSRNFKAVYGLTPAAWAGAVVRGPRRSLRPGTLRSVPPAPTRTLRLARTMNA